MLRSLLLAMVGVLATSPSALSQAAPQSSNNTVVAEARRTLATRYVLPATAEELSTALERAEAAGRYRGLSGDALAERISADLYAVARDKHLGLRFDPQKALELQNLRPGANTLPASYPRQVTAVNAGVRRLEVLPGNIRYLALDGFYWGTPGAEEALATAMRVLRDGDAIILDLRNNGGGWPPAVAALTGYFVPAGTPLTRFEMRGAPGEASKAPSAPFSLRGKPLYVLTSGNTASAAEEFASHVSAFGFGTLVGAPTAGAAYRNEFVPLSGGYVLSVSVGRPVHAKTGGDWEAKGVAPTIATAPERALLRAQAEAMAVVAQRAPEAERPAAGRLLAYYRALATPAAPALPLKAYAGRYGERTVKAGENGLIFQRDGRPATELAFMGSDRFVLKDDPTTQLRFVVEDGSVTAVELDRPGAAPTRIPRST